jgi:hypothetical protein
MKNLPCFTSAAVVISIVWSHSSSVAAQDNSAMHVDVSRCVVLLDPDQRYKCFDEITAHLRTDEQPAAVTAAAPRSVEKSNESVVDPASDTTVREFGLDSSSARVTENEEGEAELRDTIAQLEEREPGKWLITLASGQVWYQDTIARIRLKEGMGVRIYPSSFGSSYRLAADESNAVIQVRRVK